MNVHKGFDFGVAEGKFFTGGLSDYVDGHSQGRQFKVVLKKANSLYDLALRELARALKDVYYHERRRLAEYLVKLDAKMHGKPLPEGCRQPKDWDGPRDDENFSALSLKTYDSLPAPEIRKRDLVNCLWHDPEADCLICCEPGIYSLSPVQGSFEGKTPYYYKIKREGTFVLA
jgi:hypothetical protein